MRKTFDTPGPIEVHARLAAGEVDVEAADTAETVVELEPRNDAAERVLDEVIIELRDSRLVIEVPDRRGIFAGSPEFDLRVRCPTGSRLEVRTASADLHSSGRLGALDVKTASGDIRAGESEGETRIGTASGDVELESSRGPVEVSCTSGDVDIGRAAAGLRANLISGDLRVSELDGGAALHSVSGDVTLEAVGPGSVRASSVSGDVRIGVKPGCDVWMDVKTLSGDTVSDLESQDGPPADRSRLVEIVANTTSGDVHIGRASAASVS